MVDNQLQYLEREKEGKQDAHTLGRDREGTPLFESGPTAAVI